MFTIIGADGKEYGPVTAAHVLDWLRDGRVNLQTQARLNREGVWKPLGNFTEFNRQPVAAPPVSASPFLTPFVEPAAPAATEASRWLRLPAAAIDGLLKFLCYLPITIPALRVAAAEALRGEQRTMAEMSQIITQIVEENAPHALPWFALLVLVQFGLLTWRGQSIGKLVLGLRIVRSADQGPAGFMRAFLLRGTVPLLIEQTLFLIAQNPFLGLFFWLVDSCYIFRGDRRCLHDLIAGTKVVKA